MLSTAPMAEHVALRSPVLNGHALDPAAKISKGKKTAAPPRDAVKTAPSAGVTKRKQSKSRNGNATRRAMTPRGLY